jgi:molybdopterin/thiamine biosynthesis adenylyltransferase
MNNLEMQRYSRQIQLPQVGEMGQDKLLKSRVLIIGLGWIRIASSTFI